MKQLCMDADAQAIHLVNSAADARRWKAQKQKLDRWQALENERCRITAMKSLTKRTIIECGGCAGVGVLIYAAMCQDMISQGLALPIAVTCLILAGYRLNDYCREIAALCAKQKTRKERGTQAWNR